MDEFFFIKTAIFRFYFFLVRIVVGSAFPFKKVFRLFGEGRVDICTSSGTRALMLHEKIINGLEVVCIRPLGFVETQRNARYVDFPRINDLKYWIEKMYGKNS